ncbi:uncharacterized protein LOC113309195 [Papaver somniferum]|uniref:uncharacterized protein LOC113309108 n=1 Tax=Papaver somniferum TaxID=3469 RepID=UPI000E6F5136|nr:uncharacterized protein LOC113309108 [Papaver somniferum]XP_026413389.1 uncharacterized protein LOC113309195 [Papaver somniferum]
MRLKNYGMKLKLQLVPRRRILMLCQEVMKLGLKLNCLMIYETNWIQYHPLGLPGRDGAKTTGCTGTMSGFTEGNEGCFKKDREAIKWAATRGLKTDESLLLTSDPA